MGIGSILGSVVDRVKQAVSSEPAAPPPAPPPPPRPSTPPSYESGFDKPGLPPPIQDGRAAGGKDANALPEVIAARSQASKNGDVPFDIGPGANVEGLLRASPQVDANPKTTEDGHRCAAASAFNAMLIEGRPQQNAEALEKYAAKVKYNFAPEEREALDAMKSGKLTPRQAGVMQEAVYHVAQKNQETRDNRDGSKKGPDRVTKDGLTTSGVAEVIGGIRAYGGLSTLKEVSINMQTSKASDGTPFGHATLSAQKADGSWISVDTWPNKKGESTVTNSPTPMDVVSPTKDGKTEPRPGAIGIVTLQNDGTSGSFGRIGFAYPTFTSEGRPQLVQGSTTDLKSNQYDAGTLKEYKVTVKDLLSGQKVRVDPMTGTPLPDVKAD